MDNSSRGGHFDAKRGDALQTLMTSGLLIAAKDAPSNDDADLTGRTGLFENQATEIMADEPMSTTQRLMETETTSSLLENLPAELRLKVLLCIPNLETLRSLVHASPTLHAQYLYDRNRILCSCMDRETNGFVVDAYATLMSRAVMLGDKRTNETISGFLEIYRGLITGSVPDLRAKMMPASGVRWLAAYHTRIAQPLARSYSKWAFAKLRQEAQNFSHDERSWPPAVESDPELKLTKAEEIRIFRALYRYETYWHLFGRNQGTRNGLFSPRKINRIFFCLFNPWDVEAIGCIELFMRENYEHIFNRVKEYFGPTNIEFEKNNGAYGTEKSIDLTLQQHREYMDGMISRGLKLAVRLLAIDCHNKLAATMERYLPHSLCLDAPMRAALSTEAQEGRRRMPTATSDLKDEAEERRDSMEFIGDTMSANGPPFAWVLLWNGIYANTYGEHVPKALRLCSYVIWDKCRWTEVGAREFLETQWENNPELAYDIESRYHWSPLTH